MNLERALKEFQLDFNLFTTASVQAKKAMDRKAELERKKAKLAAIREEKERRRREKEAKDMEDATNKIATGQEKDSRRLVQSIVTKFISQ